MTIKSLHIASVHHPFKWNKWLRYVTAAIRFFTRSKWNHTSVIEEYQDGSFCVVEMNTDGCNRHKLDKEWAEDKTIEVLTPTFLYDVDRMHSNLNILVETKQKYDYRGTCWYGLWYHIGKSINKRFGTNIKWMGFTSAGKAAERFYCSEMAAWLFNKERPELFQQWWLLDPATLRELARGDFYVSYIGKATDIHLEMKAI